MVDPGKKAKRDARPCTHSPRQQGVLSCCMLRLLSVQTLSPRQCLVVLFFSHGAGTTIGQMLVGRAPVYSSVSPVCIGLDTMCSSHSWCYLLRDVVFTAVFISDRSLYPASPAPLFLFCLCRFDALVYRLFVVQCLRVTGDHGY